MRILSIIFFLCFGTYVVADDVIECQTPCCQEYQNMIQSCSASEREYEHTSDCLKTTQMYQECKKQHPEIYGPGFE